MNLMFEPLRKYATFTGRARRMEFWLFWLFTFVVGLVSSMLTGGLGPDPLHPAFGLGFLIYCVISLALFIPSLAVGFRRLHDTDRSAWWLLIGLIPLLGALVLIVFFLLEGTRGPNKYGPDPKGEGVEAAAAAA